MLTLSQSKQISTWLLCTIVMVILMILIGGITRLTDSGLSMVEWRLLWGFLPPSSENEWNRVFELYMNSPEYILKNNGMTLEEFKRIFFWEYFHRLWGRLIGIVFMIPMIFFLVSNKIPKYILPKIFIILFLGSLQEGYSDLTRFLKIWQLARNFFVLHPHDVPSWCFLWARKSDIAGSKWG